jgi:hypothetical protein
LIQSTRKEEYEELKRIEGEETAKRKTEEQDVRVNVERAVGILAARNLDYYAAQIPSDFPRELLQNLDGELPSRFVSKPETLSYCSVHENYGVFYIPDIRDWGGLCPTFEAKRAAASCSECLHYRSPVGEQEDMEQLNRLTTGIAVNDPGAVSIIESRKATLEQSIGPSKALDIALAYDHKGKLPARRKYLSFCVRHNVVPEMFNRFGDCAAFKARQAGVTEDRPAAAGEFPRDQRSTPRDSGASEPTRVTLKPLPDTPGVPAQTGKTVLEALGLSPFGSSPAPSDLDTQASSIVSTILGKLVCGSNRGAQEDASEIPAGQVHVLFPGRPPLTNEMLRRSTAVAGAAMSTNMSTADRERYETLVARAWQTNALELTKLQLQLISFYPAVLKGQFNRDEALNNLQRFFQGSGADRSRSDCSSPAGERSRSEQHAADASKVCARGHANSGEGMFCEMCGKPLKSPSEMD